jgi:Lon protease-like protein
MPDLLEIPIFPLDNVVLFPQVQVPLYIFEPRYRQMTAAALEGDGQIGMAVALPAHRSEMSGDPPIFPVACLGRIGHSESNEDGTYQIILEGTHRIRVHEEVPKDGERLYRVARVELMDDPAPEPADDLAPTRDRVLEMMRQIVPDNAERFRRETFAKLDDAIFVSVFCQSLDFDALEMQQLLEANGVRARADQLVALMEFRIAEHSATGATGSETVH